MFKAPIELYGRVEDQPGKPIPRAKVELYVMDSPIKSKSSPVIEMTSDAKGEFSVKGLHGAMMGVNVSKDGCVRLSPLGGPASQATVEYAAGSKSGKLYSNPKTPLVMCLHDPGPMEPLVVTSRERKTLAIDGTPGLVALDSIKGVGSHNIEFRLWSNMREIDKPGAHVYDAYDWIFEARIPGGGFVWSDSCLSGEAPEAGYKEMIRYHLPKSMPREKWKSFRYGRYYVKFPDGTYGRIDFDIDSMTDPKYGPLYFQSWFNPKPGSRNLASLYKGEQFTQKGDPEKME